MHLIRHIFSQLTNFRKSDNNLIGYRRTGQYINNNHRTVTQMLEESVAIKNYRLIKIISRDR